MIRARALALGAVRGALIGGTTFAAATILHIRRVQNHARCT